MYTDGMGGLPVEADPGLQEEDVVQPSFGVARAELHAFLTTKHPPPPP